MRSFSGCDVRFTLEGRADVLSLQVRTAVFKIVQQAVMNAVRGGKAKFVRIMIGVGADVLRAKVVDDGVGFDVDKERELRRSAARGGCEHGGTSTHDRGGVSIMSEPGRGTTVLLEVPLSKKCKEKRRPVGGRRVLFQALRRFAFLRSLSSRMDLRRRIDFGVTSTSSSSAIHSRAFSRVILRGTSSFTVKSFVDDLWLVACFRFVGLQGISPGREFSPTIIRVDPVHRRDEKDAPLLKVLKLIARRLSVSRLTSAPLLRA